jgi:hypothetical protein
MTIGDRIRPSRAPGTTPPDPNDHLQRRTATAHRPGTDRDRPQPVPGTTTAAQPTPTRTAAHPQEHRSAERDGQQRWWWSGPRWPGGPAHGWPPGWAWA